MNIKTTGIKPVVLFYNINRKGKISMTKEFYILTAWIDNDTPVFLTDVIFDENDDDANMTFLWTSDMDSPNIICFDNPDDVTDIIMDIQDSEYDVYQSYNVGVRTFSKPYH